MSPPIARNAELRRDPTRSITLRRKYAGAASRRFRELKGAIRTTLVDNDALRLSRPALQQMRPESDFGFVSDASKVEAFRRWLQRQIDEGILEVDGSWQRDFVRPAYAKGLRHAEARLRDHGLPVEAESLGQTFNQPIHASKLELLFTRNFTELEGITSSMGQSITRELTEGLSQGLNPREMARNLNGRVDAIGIKRARTMARTEVVRAHAESTITRFEQSGVEEVRGQAEFATAGDDRVCPICEGLDGDRFSLEEARGLIPVHPNCRCTWLPVTRLST